VTTVDWSRVERARRLAELEAEVLRCAVEWHNTKGYSNEAYLALAALHNAVAAYIAERGA
jgi:hypothetical protein